MYMIQKKWIRYTAMVALVALPVVTAGCGLFSKQASKQIDPPQVETGGGIQNGGGEEAAPSGQALPDNAAAAAQDSSVTVYLADRNGYVAPVSVPVTLAENETYPRRALELMVENGMYASSLPEDFRPLIPQGTVVLGYDYDEEHQVAKVDFSSAFNDYYAGDERSIVEAITWTLTAMTGIKGVELSVEGERLAEMPQAAYPIDNVLTRSIGINIEAADGVDIVKSSPVTLYFSAQTLHDEQYYVPVTRLVERSDSAPLAAMEELIAGPLNQKELTSVIWPDVEVAGLEVKDGVAVLDLEDESFGKGSVLPAEMLQAVVLSLTENSNAETVQIRINGESNLVDDQQKSYSEPVGRPHHVNALKS